MRAKVVPIRKGYIIFCNSSDNIDRTFRDNCIEKLHRFIPIMPIDFKSKRTNIVNGLDQNLKLYTDEELMNSINRGNDWQ